MQGVTYRVRSCPETNDNSMVALRGRFWHFPEYTRIYHMRQFSMIGEGADLAHPSGGARHHFKTSLGTTYTLCVSQASPSSSQKPAGSCHVLSVAARGVPRRQHTVEFLTALLPGSSQSLPAKTQCPKQSSQHYQHQADRCDNGTRMRHHRACPCALPHSCGNHCDSCSMLAVLLCMRPPLSAVHAVLLPPLQWLRCPALCNQSYTCHTTTPWHATPAACDT
jgi:hypothetical protein